MDENNALLEKLNNIVLCWLFSVLEQCRSILPDLFINCVLCWNKCLHSVLFWWFCNDLHPSILFVFIHEILLICYWHCLIAVIFCLASTFSDQCFFSVLVCSFSSYLHLSTDWTSFYFPWVLMTNGDWWYVYSKVQLALLNHLFIFIFCI